MAFVGLKVDETTKRLWVETATGQGLSLSAWLKECAAARLGGGEAGRHPGRAETPGHVTAERPAGGAPNDSRVSSPPNPDTQQEVKAEIAEARRLLADREFKPDFKKGKTK